MKENNKDLKSNLPEISIIIPIYNEEKNIERYPKDLFSHLDALKKTYEVIAVDDGSYKDKSWLAMVNLSKKYKFFHALKHSRNYGMGAAYQSGFDYSRGKYVITYSADLEISAKYIKDVVKKLDEGYDVVNTHRIGRWNESKKGGVLRKIPSEIANFLIEEISGVKVRDTGSGLKGFKRFVVDNLKIYGDMHRFLLAYSSLYTKKIIELPVEYQERTYGASAYGSILRTFSVFLDLFSMKFMLSFATKPFSMMPGRIFGSIGLISMSLGFVATAYLLALKVLFGETIGERPIFIAGLMLIVLGVQLVMTGLLGELLMRVYFESSGRKPYIVSEVS